MATLNLHFLACKMRVPVSLVMGCLNEVVGGDALIPLQARGYTGLDPESAEPIKLLPKNRFLLGHVPGTPAQRPEAEPGAPPTTPVSTPVEIRFLTCKNKAAPPSPGCHELGCGKGWAHKKCSVLLVR